MISHVDESDPGPMPAPPPGGVGFWALARERTGIMGFSDFLSARKWVWIGTKGHGMAGVAFGGNHDNGTRNRGGGTRHRSDDMTTDPRVQRGTADEDPHPEPMGESLFINMLERYNEMEARTVDLEKSVTRLMGESPTPLSTATKPGELVHDDFSGPLLSRFRKLNDAMARMNARLLTALDRLNSFV